MTIQVLDKGLPCSSRCGWTGTGRGLPHTTVHHAICQMCHNGATRIFTEHLGFWLVPHPFKNRRFPFTHLKLLRLWLAGRLGGQL